MTVYIIYIHIIQVVTAYNNSLQNLKISRRLVGKSITENIARQARRFAIELLKKALNIYRIHANILQVRLTKQFFEVKYNIHDYIVYIPEKEICCFPKRTPGAKPD